MRLYFSLFKFVKASEGLEYKIIVKQTEVNKDLEFPGQWCPDYVTNGLESALFALSGP